MTAMRSAQFRRRRLNWVCRWVGLLIAVVALGLYAQGLRRYVWGFRAGRAEVHVYRGMTGLTWYRAEVANQPWFRVARGRAGAASDMFPFWMSPQIHFGERWIEAFIPLWMYVVSAGGVSALAWRRRLRWSPPGVCPKCRYDMTGLQIGSACPECGRASVARTNNAADD